MVTLKTIRKHLRIIAVGGVRPGAGEASRGDDSLDAEPMSQSSSPTRNKISCNIVSDSWST